MTTAEELRPWLGDAWDELTPDQRDRFARCVDDIDTRHPGNDLQEDRTEAMNTALQWLLGDVTTREAGDRLAHARAEESRARISARQIAIMAIEDGATEAATARELGVDRMAVRTWTGKR